MNILRNVSLQAYNTFGIRATAECMAVVESVEDLAAIAGDASLPTARRVLGGGSNILLSTPVLPGLTVLARLRGIADEREDAAHVYLRAAARESWHDVVMHAVGRGLGGIENLALIWGTAGAAPIQNIGAYGAEVKNVIEEVEVWDWAERRSYKLSAGECGFGYRDSIFKRELKDRVVVTSILLRLSKCPVPNTSYGAIADELRAAGAEERPSVADVAAAVVRIRQSKLPDPREVGNAGSFFKNPTISKADYEALQKEHPAIPSYPVADPACVKVPAGWLIEQCGWKGRTVGAAGVHSRQALVLVNRGGATGEEIWALSRQVVESVQSRFGIRLAREVQVW